jgi:(1->4)-alpha-D-glucan 1-alpha-D-glucosylmutase
LTLKATMPGVPDFYQGTELWDLSLVDPDNRRPVDFAARSQMIDVPTDWPALAAQWHDGHIKFALTRRLLAWRQENRAVFARGDYRPLAVRGPHRDHVVAFARTHRRRAVIVVVARNFAPFTSAGTRWPNAGDWQADIALDGLTAVRSLLTPGAPIDGTVVPAATLFAAMPLALLDAEVRRG